MTRRKFIGTVIATGAAVHAFKEVNWERPKEPIFVEFTLEDGSQFALPMVLAAKTEKTRTFQPVRFKPTVETTLKSACIWYQGKILSANTIEAYLIPGDEFIWIYTVTMDREEQAKAKMFLDH